MGSDHCKLGFIYRTCVCLARDGLHDSLFHFLVVVVNGLLVCVCVWPLEPCQGPGFASEAKCVLWW